MKTKTLASILACLFTVAAQAQDPTYARVAETVEEKIIILDIDCRDADIRTVILQIADLAEVNVRIPADLKGDTTLRLHGLTWQQAIDTLAFPFGYRHQSDGNIVDLVEVHPQLKPSIPLRELISAIPTPKLLIVSVGLSALASILSAVCMMVSIVRKR